MNLVIFKNFLFAFDTLYAKIRLFLARILLICILSNCFPDKSDVLETCVYCITLIKNIIRVF